MIYAISLNFHLKLKFYKLFLCFNPVYNFKKVIEILLIKLGINIVDSVFNIPRECLHVEFFNLFKVIELWLSNSFVEFIRNQAIIDESICDSADFTLKKRPRLFIAIKHELYCLMVLNIHHHF